MYINSVGRGVVVSVDCHLIYHMVYKNIVLYIFNMFNNDFFFAYFVVFMFFFCRIDDVVVVFFIRSFFKLR